MQLKEISRSESTPLANYEECFDAQRGAAAHKDNARANIQPTSEGERRNYAESVSEKPTGSLKHPPDGCKMASHPQESTVAPPHLET